MHRQRIAIIGAGTAGLATAALLARQGHAITLIERASALTAVGAGILLQPSGIDALTQLGCATEMQEYGQRIDALIGQIPSGRAIMNVRYADLNAEPDLFGLGVHRAALCHVLDRTLSRESHTRWFDCEVEALDQNPGAVRLRFQQNGQVHQESFDAVLVANGSASRLRPKELVRYDRQYPWGAIWLIAPLTDELAGFDVPVLQQRYAGAHQMIGMLPTGRTPENARLQISLFWSLPVSEMAAWQSSRVDFSGWKSQLTRLWPELWPLLERIESPSSLLPATYRDVILSRWGCGRIGIIGDAAHAMSPQLGQGANMALLDAVVLARAVAENADWEGVWQYFQQERTGSIRFYQRMSRLLTPMFQSRIPGAGWIRDLSFPLARQVPWLRRHMVETVAGRKKRWL